MTPHQTQGNIQGSITRISSEEQFLALVEAVPDAVVVVDAEGKIAIVNRQTELLFGYSRQELLGQPAEMLLPERHRAEHLALRSGYTERPRVRPMGVGLELLGVRRDGSEFPVEISLSPVEGPSGMRVFSAIRDISRSKRIEEELRQARSELKARVQRRTAELARERDRAQLYLDVAQVALLALDCSGRIEMISRKGLNILGYEEKELIGRDWFSVCMPARHRDDARRLFRKILDGELIEYIEIPAVTKAGEERLMAWHNTLLRDPAGEIVGTLSSGEDITERVKLEQQLRQAHKMEAIGRLAGGIAHDFNNLLGVILGDSELLLAEGKLEEAQRKPIEEIKEAGERAASLTRDLLAFSRQQILEKPVVELSVVLNGFKDMLQRLAGPKLTLQMTVNRDAGAVRADPTQLLQVILNLVVNARDAMPQGGNLRIETASVSLDAAEAASDPDIQPGRYAQITIADDGPGMDRETLSHIFEPFFTTKGVGQGAGMGLATAYGIIHQLGGSIRAYSEPGQGATFQILLPQVNQAATPAVKPPSREELPRGTETVLLVEDAGLLRRVTQQFLERIGYVVLAAEDGPEAMAISAQHNGNIHLLLTDIVMPGMNGEELAERLRKSRPGLKVLYASGYADSILANRESPASDVPFIEKPFTWQQLALKIRGILDQA